MAKKSSVFISYSHDSPEHKNRVLAFGSRLVTEGIDAMIDQWIDDPPGGWPFWMEHQMAASDFVLLVCTGTYRRRVERGQEERGGLGVFWESNLLRTRLYTTKGVDRRFLPVFFGDSGTDAIPEILQGATHYQIDSPDGYNALYRRLTDQPEVIRPELGELIVLPRSAVSSPRGQAATRPAEHEFSLPVASAFKKLTRASCSEESSLRSRESTVSTFVRFDNYLGEDVVIYWLDYEGIRVLYAVLQAGRSHLQQTYLTHPWVVTKKYAQGSHGKCIALFQPIALLGIADID